MLHLAMCIVDGENELARLRRERTDNAVVPAANDRATIGVEGNAMALLAINKERERERERVCVCVCECAYLRRVLEAVNLARD